MFELVDSSPEGWIGGQIPEGQGAALLPETFETLAGALSRTRTAEWRSRPWKVYDPEGYVVRDWASNS
ncbi:hypothetical protein ACT17_34260 [Mycolicibacterium conceptionense]|uniref:Uncharacterized protein n=1 Tax=Mycolicibacterium conceptionense TaxID=451644 RepID=A0A0J8TW13_9MYCO|nr:hypothetical protein [Mycolicibacterium conceptionense]KMV13618.1 hypothetical protein ACT17_34260 [Mycolicibacterium conceptionense]